MNMNIDNQGSGPSLPPNLVLKRAESPMNCAKTIDPSNRNTDCVLADRFSGLQCIAIRRWWQVTCCGRINCRQMINRWCYRCFRPGDLLYAHREQHKYFNTSDFTSRRYTSSSLLFGCIVALYFMYLYFILFFISFQNRKKLEIWGIAQHEAARRPMSDLS